MPATAAMPQRETVLETAAFLDSPQARSAGLPDRRAVQAIVERFLDSAFAGVGKAPRHLDAEDLHQILGHDLPARFAKKDPLAKDVPAVLRAYVDSLEQRAILPQAYELRAALEENLPHFTQAVASGKAHSHDHGGGGPPQKPFVNRADKVGRNDPCPCGSGKKFKQCCARTGS
jgi:SEC-C motif-containing protein